ncbi:IclR family transcriptional regulator [Leucobacter sp. HNU]|uniref:IclR family transcriptional regulator n=1 Tax=Leucobacter sp. HNU TaxID=3236805 RepID=UPI003A7FBF0E
MAATPSSLAQGALLVRVVAERERSGRSGFTALRLSERTGIERSRVSRLTQELVDLGYLLRDEGAVFRVGPAYFALASALHEPWLRSARSELRRIASLVRASVRVWAPSGARAVLLRHEAGPGAPGAATTPGMVVPAWCTGGGRALFWRDSAEELSARLAGVDFVGAGGPRAATSPSEVVALMERDRSAGMVRAEEEFEYGILELAAPILVEDRVIASVSAACHQDDGSEAALRSELESAAEHLTALAAEGGAEHPG